MSETLLQYSVSGAEAQMRQFAQVAQTCASFPVATHRVSIAVSLSREAFPVFGNDTVAVRITANLAKYRLSISADVVAVRHGGTVIVVTNVALPLDSGLTQSTMAAAYAKVAARW